MTTSTVTASAPGKIFLLGEYAVLAGHGALIGAVDRRVTARFSPAPGPLRIGGSLLSDALTADVVFSERGFDGALSRIVAGLRAAYGDEAPAFLGGALEVDSSSLFSGGRKLGYGSSAAVVVAVCAATTRALGKAFDPAAAFAACKRWHNRAQRADGSGGDVAASLMGGVAWLQHERIEGLPGRIPLAVFQHAKSASTPALVGAAKAYAQRQHNAYARHMGVLGALASAAKSTLAARDPAGFCAVVRDANAALDAFGAAAGIGILTDSHRRAAYTCEQLGGACKPAGAGGGDISLVTAPDEATLDTIIAALGDECRRVPLAEHGVIC